MDGIDVTNKLRGEGGRTYELALPHLALPHLDLDPHLRAVGDIVKQLETLVQPPGRGHIAVVAVVWPAAVFALSSADFSLSVSVLGLLFVMPKSLRIAVL